MPITYFGSLDYFVLIARSDEVWIEACESYPKQTLRNRCKILGANGLMDLTIPIAHQENRLISQFQSDEATNWRNQHWQALLSAYKSSPFFQYIEADLEQFYQQNHQPLFQLLYENTLQWCKWLGIKTTIHLTTDFEVAPADKLDFRDKFKPSKYPSLFSYEEYYQVFSDKHGFQSNLSILDLFCNEGRQALSYLMQIPAGGRF